VHSSELPQGCEQTHVRNVILSGLSAEDFELLKPLLRRVTLRKGLVLQEQNWPTAHVDFLESGAASLFLRTRKDGAIGVSIVGRFGFIGVSIVLGTDRSPHRCIMQIAGEALRISSSDLLRSLTVSDTLRSHLNRYVQALLFQHSQTVLCVSRHTLEGRLASSLLAISDRVESRAITITHQLMSRMLGVRRAGVTTAAVRLEDAGAVARRRGQILIADRAKLEAMSCGCYRHVALEYSKLLDAPLPRSDRAARALASPV
jgi:CRP-like cAMP-binding protein